MVLTLVMPGMPFAAALALGAIVAPPDAVAAVARGPAGRPAPPAGHRAGGRVAVQRRDLLVTLKVAIAAIGAGSIAWGSAIGEFAWASAGGMLIGAALGLALSFVRRTADSALTITALSLVSPFAAYLLGEAAHASGVLVVVVTGLVLGYRSPIEVPASVRLTETATWAALRFVLEGAVFALIGLQLRASSARWTPARTTSFVAIAAVLATVIISRPIWIALIHLVSRLGRAPRRGRLDRRRRGVLGGHARRGVAGRRADTADGHAVPVACCWSARSR